MRQHGAPETTDVRALIPLHSCLAQGNVALPSQALEGKRKTCRLSHPIDPRSSRSPATSQPCDLGPHVPPTTGWRRRLCFVQVSTREVRKLSPQHTAGPPHGLGIAISTQLRSPSPHQPGHQGFRWTLCTSPACCQPSLESACVGVGVTRGLFP